ncbi:MAG: hypothetical protein ACYDDF_00870 [Thermoplasmatota archaeon]
MIRIVKVDGIQPAWGIAILVAGLVLSAVDRVAGAYPTLVAVGLGLIGVGLVWTVGDYLRTASAP